MSFVLLEDDLHILFTTAAITITSAARTPPIGGTARGAFALPSFTTTTTTTRSRRPKRRQHSHLKSFSWPLQHNKYHNDNKKPLPKLLYYFTFFVLIF
jgi:hypothetical protein